MMVAALFTLGVCGLLFVHGGYGLILHASASVARRARPTFPGFSEADLPSVTVLVSAFNEAGKIAKRIENIARLDYPTDRLELFVVSDGSSDGTAEAARAEARRHPELTVKVVEFVENRGRHAAQNLAAQRARGSIIITTDADSEFERDFVRQMVEPFSSPDVAVVGGEKRYRSLDSSIAESIGLYQRVEYWTRMGEDRWDVLAKTDGPCTAFRKDIWSDLEEFEDVDHAIVAVAWRHGKIARHAPDAVCYERPNETPSQELRARARMTRKGLLTIRNRWPFRRIFRAPARTLALYAHRHVRFLSPLFLVLTLATAALWMVSLHWSLALGAILLVASFLSVPHKAPFIGSASKHARSLFLANLGFAGGIAGYLRGDKSGRYKPTHTPSAAGSSQ